MVFLQNWRAAVVPIVTIPVLLIGTFAVMSFLDVSINMLSLFGIVLAIRIVVDEAIVVVENSMHNIDESGLSPKEATMLAMREVTGPIIAATVVLLIFFVPAFYVLVERVTDRLKKNRPQPAVNWDSAPDVS